MASRSGYRRGWAVAAVLVAILCSQAPGRVITVNAGGTGDYPTIQAAIDAAVGGDEVVLLPGTYTGDGNRDIDYLGKAITVRGTDSNDPSAVFTTIIECQGTKDTPHNGINFLNREGPGSIVAGITIRGGYGPLRSILGSTMSVGGAIFSDEGAAPVIANCRLVSCRAVEGGAIYCRGDAITISGCTIRDNIAYSGAGIYLNNTSAIVDNCLIVANAMFSGSCFGSGIYASKGTPTVSRCNISHNGDTTSHHRGALYLDRTQAKVMSCVFTGNRQQWCIVSAMGENHLANCTIAENAHNSWGGAVYARYHGITRVTNCICWGNSDYIGQEREIDGDTGTQIIIAYSNVRGGATGTGNINSDPGFRGTDNFSLKPTSPCIDRGTNQIQSWIGDYDIDGYSRILDGDGDDRFTIDMGAFEFAREIPMIWCSTEVVRLYARETVPEMNSQVLQIGNARDGVLNWRVTEDCPWLGIEPAIGASHGLLTEATVTVDASGLMRGSYETTFSIQDANAVNNPRTVYVNLTVLGPVIGSDPQQLAMETDIFERHVLDRTLTIINNGGSVLDWSIVEDIPWLSVDMLAGACAAYEGGDVTVRVDCSQLSAGNHTGILTVVDPLAENTPLVVPVTLYIAGAVIQPSRDKLDFHFDEKGRSFPDSQIIEISNSGMGNLDWTVESDSDWLKATRLNEKAVEVTVDATVATYGQDYLGQVLVCDANAENSPFPIDVQLTADCILTTHSDYAEWVDVGRPRCWCFKTQCHGDADGLKEGGAKGGYVRVHFRDLDILLSAWNVAEPPHGPGLSGASFVDAVGPAQGICADFAHNVEGSAKTGFYRVHFSDLNILLAYWNIKEPTFGSGVPQDCPGNIAPWP